MVERLNARRGHARPAPLTSTTRCVPEPAQRRVRNRRNTEMKHHKQKLPVESLAYPTQMTAFPPSPSTSLPGRTIVYSTPLSRICARNLPKWNLQRNVQRRRKLLDASETATSMNSSRNGNGRRKPPGFAGVRR